MIGSNGQFVLAMHWKVKMSEGSSIEIYILYVNDAVVNWHCI